MTAFTADAARALSGPDWLRDRRVEAAERFAASSLPTTEEEVWRYSRIDELDIEQFTPSGAAAIEGGARQRVDALLTLGGIEAAARVVTSNGVVVSREGDDALVVPLTEPDLLGLAGDAPDIFTTMNDAFAPEPLLVRFARGKRTAPVVIVHWVAGDDTLAFPRLVVDAADGSEGTVVEVFASPLHSAALLAPVTELRVGQAANLGYLGVQVLGASTWQIGTQRSVVGRDATLTSAGAAFGGDYARLRTDCRLEGRGATGDLLSVYFGEGTQTLDFRTFQDHAAPDTTSNLLFKGAVGGASRSVYTGMIRVRKDARGTNAFQTNRNIKLSNDAWAESVPNLEIENNDVKCSHASAVGPVDEDQRFYLESRGVPTAIAERLVVTGFFDEVLDKLPVAAAGPVLHSLISDKLDRIEQ